MDHDSGTTLTYTQSGPSPITGMRKYVIGIFGVKSVLPENPFPKDFDGWRRDCNADGKPLPGREGKRLADFLEIVKEKQKVDTLSLANVLALRLYTTKSFVLFNQPLRDVAIDAETNEMNALSDGLRKPHPLPLTMNALCDGLKKLRFARQSEVDAPSQADDEQQPQPPSEYSGAGDIELVASMDMRKAYERNETPPADSKVVKLTTLWRGINVKSTETFIKKGGYRIVHTLHATVPVTAHRSLTASAS